jgi:DNA-binding MarR family transcriptional regulator
MSDVPDVRVPLETAVEDLLRATGQLLRRLRAASNPTELSWSQTAILARLAEVGWMTTADLARAESVKPQSMGATVVVLEAEGLVQRRPHPTDGRQVLFGLTELGSATRQRNSHLKREWLLAAMARLDPTEQQNLIRAVALIKRLADS